MKVQKAGRTRGFAASSSVRDQGKVKETTRANSYVEHITEPWRNKKKQGKSNCVCIKLRQVSMGRDNG